jgi:hypothetical protein
MSIRGLAAAFAAVGASAIALFMSMALAFAHHLDYSAILVFSVGLVIVALALFRPVWLWHDEGLAILRSLLGRAGATALSCAVGLWAIGAGIAREVLWSQEIHTCQSRYAQVHGLRATRAIDRYTPRPSIPDYLTAFLPYQPESCSTHYDHGDLN